MGLLNDDSAQLEVILYRLETAALSGAERLSRFVEAALEVGADPDRAAARRDLGRSCSVDRIFASGLQREFGAAGPSYETRSRG